LGVGGGDNASASRHVILDNVTFLSLNASNYYNLAVGPVTLGTSTASLSNHTLEIKNGSVITAGALHTGPVAGSNGNTLLIDQSTVYLNSGWTVAGAGTGARSDNQMIVSGGSYISSRFGQVGLSGATNNTFILTSGTVVINSTPSATTNYFLVAYGGNTATINGGLVSIQNDLGTAYLRASAGASFTINAGEVIVDVLRRDSVDTVGIIFNGGTLKARTSTHANHSFTVGNGEGNTAVFELLEGGTHTFSSLSINTNGILRGSGKVIGNTTVFGQLAAGNAESTGFIEFDNALALQSGATTLISIAGLGEAEFDHFAVAGTLTLDGTLKITLLGDLVPAYQDSFQLFTAGTILGDFTHIDVTNAPLASGLYWNFEASTGLLTVIPEGRSSHALLIGSLLLFSPLVSRRHTRKNPSHV